MSLLRPHAIATILLLLPLVSAEEVGGAAGADLGVAVMLLSAVTFMMSTFYLVNAKDEDIVSAAWQVISSTISIFCAVLLFQAVNETVGFYFVGQLEGEDDSKARAEVVVAFVHAGVWYVALQASLAFISGAVSLEELSGRDPPVPEDDSSDDDPDRDVDEDVEDYENLGKSLPEEPDEPDKPKATTCGKAYSIEHKQEVEVNMKCWAVLVGHITGFASINAFGIVQQQVLGSGASGSVYDCFLGMASAVFAYVMMRILFAVVMGLRMAISRADDGAIDEMEQMWEAETTETEDDILGLAISFLVVQVIRMWVTGILPNEEGEVAAGQITYSLWQGGILISIGSVSQLLHFLRQEFIHGMMGKRMKEQFTIVSGMLFAWCFFFGMQYAVSWIVRNVLGLEDGEGLDTIRAVCISMVVTFLSYIMIFCLDKLADAEWTHDDVDAAINDLIKALGILIGFAWEKAFDAAVVSCTRNIRLFPPAVTKMALSVTICSIVIPAWRFYILPQLQALNCFEEFEEKEEEIKCDEESAEAGDLEAGPVAREGMLITAHRSTFNEADRRRQRRSQASAEGESATVVTSDGHHHMDLSKLEGFAIHSVPEQEAPVPRDAAEALLAPLLNKTAPRKREARQALVKEDPAVAKATGGASDQQVADAEVDERAERQLASQRRLRRRRRERVVELRKEAAAVAEDAKRLPDQIQRAMAELAAIQAQLDRHTLIEESSNGTAGAVPQPLPETRSEDVSSLVREARPLEPVGQPMREPSIPEGISHPSQEAPLIPRTLRELGGGERHVHRDVNERAARSMQDPRLSGGLSEALRDVKFVSRAEPPQRPTYLAERLPPSALLAADGAPRSGAYAGLPPAADGGGSGMRDFPSQPEARLSEGGPRSSLQLRLGDLGARSLREPRISDGGLSQWQRR